MHKKADNMYVTYDLHSHLLLQTYSFTSEGDLGRLAPRES